MLEVRHGPHSNDLIGETRVKSGELDVVELRVVIDP